MLAPERGTEGLPSHHYYRQPLEHLFSFAYFLLLPVNGTMYSLKVISSLAKSSSN